MPYKQPRISIDKTFLYNKQKWYSEINNQWPGRAFSFIYDDLIFEKQSKYQHIKIFSTQKLGKVLVLDDVVQITDNDAFAYQEMITHLPMLRHKNPKRVLVVGGGDGTVVHEICRYDSVEDIVMIEIDREVVEACKKYLRSNNAWSDPRVKVKICDASKELEKEIYHNYFDVVICDTTDPVGPAEKLFKDSFYSNLKKCLRPDGVACFQSQCIWLEMEYVVGLQRKAKKHFKWAKLATVQTPTYPCGEIGLMVCSNAEKFPAPMKCPFPDDLQYYHDEMSYASFVMPLFAQRLLSDK